MWLKNWGPCWFNCRTQERTLGGFAEVAVDQPLVSEKTGFYSGSARELLGVVRGKLWGQGDK